MTNYEALYNQTMAHNAMLRDAIDAADSCLLSYKMGELAGWEIALYSRKREAALNATGPDVEAWMINFQNKSIDTTIKLYESEMQQLATITAERDALREYCQKKIDSPFGSYDDFTRGEVACAERILDLLEALAQKGGE